MFVWKGGGKNAIFFFYKYVCILLRCSYWFWGKRRQLGGVTSMSTITTFNGAFMRPDTLSLFKNGQLKWALSQLKVVLVRYLHLCSLSTHVKLRIGKHIFLFHQTLSTSLIEVKSFWRYYRSETIRTPQEFYRKSKRNC